MSVILETKESNGAVVQTRLRDDANIERTTTRVISVAKDVTVSFGSNVTHWGALVTTEETTEILE